MHAYNDTPVVVGTLDIWTIFRRFCTFVNKYRKQCVAVLTPIVLLPIPIVSQSPKALCGYTMLLMAVFWCTEVVPLPVTAFLPVVLLPAFGIMKTRAVCDNYIKDTNVVIIGGCIIALAIENTNLHRRIAVKILRVVGPKQRRLMFGFQLTSWFLSMCITNTATVATMLPILDAVLSQLGADNKRSSNDIVESRREVRQREIRELQAAFDGWDNPRNREPSIVASAITTDTEVELNSSDLERLQDLQGAMTNPTRVFRQPKMNISMISSSSRGKLINDSESSGSGNLSSCADRDKKKFKSFSLAMVLSVVYAANIGGVGTITGTGPNLVIKQNIDDWWANRGLGESNLTFSTWLLVGLPIAIINLALLWLWMQLLYFGPQSVFRCYARDTHDTREEEARVTAVINKERDKLGDIRFSEIVVGTLFLVLILLWFFRSPGFMSGWASYLPSGFLGTATPVMLIVFILFVVPMTIPGKENGKGMEMILNWPMVQKKFPWGVVFLMGGGFAIAEGSKLTGLSEWIGVQLQFVKVLPGFVMIYVLCVLVGILTEITSNVAICTMLMPIMSTMAEQMGQNPLYLMLPVGIATSFAFMLPVATPPNALGFEYGQMKIFDMVKAGAVLNLICIIPVAFITETWASAFFKFNEIPGFYQNGTMQGV